MARGPDDVSRLFALAVERRLPLLLGSLVVALLLVAGISLAPDPLSALLFAVTIVLYLGLLVTATVALNHHPRQMVERPGELATVGNPAPVLIAAGLTLLATGLVGDSIGDLRAHRDIAALETAYLIIWPLAVGLSWYSALGSFGVRLKSDGLHYRRPFGSLFVPWEEIESATPGRYNTVTLTGRDRTHQLKSATDAAYLAGVINSAVTARAAAR
ncbi:PH domain-containing protein [Actinoplanes sp. Pm04-4]|uniref:PH domain-containing protein n=1 Tax=Paractinoplanes pyxinae TaxID=2997416 RepID=A0ABT4B396_9ACTN|nr:PH domain-containing protein [Actinoplanes pyxinae]MCY1140973.1 PH domain-containing protein [Actinoplanes pyxinae]